mmetsp:Transcript_40061/g.64246  ORF Transcript_40061/g.64246 Transcript_40061/m.64246 type:complete len:347 (+) Transcript_40061:61-1101(+)
MSCCWCMNERELRRFIPTLERAETHVIKKLSNESKFYVMLVGFQVLYLCAVCTLILLDHETRDADAYAIIWIVSATAMLYFVFDCVKREDHFTLWTSVIVHGVVMGYAIYVSFDASVKASMGSYFQQLALATGIETVVVQLLLIAAAYRVHDSFGWYIHRRVGPDLHLQKIFRVYNIFYSLLKLDFVVSLLICILASFLVLRELETILDSVALGVNFFMLIVGNYGVREEVRIIVYILFVFSFILPSYIGYKLVSLYGNPDFGVFLISGFVSVVIRATLLTYTCKALGNFGQGLREYVFIPASIDDAESKVIDGSFSTIDVMTPELVDAPQPGRALSEAGDTIEVN